MSRLHHFLLLCMLIIGVVGCGGGGGGGGSNGNVNPGIYAAAYSRGGGSIIINIPPSGSITAVVVDENGVTYAGTLTETPGAPVEDLTGTLANVTNPTQTLDFTGTFTPIGSLITINGQFTGDFSITFTANEVHSSTNLKVSDVAASYTGTVTIMQGTLQLDSGNVNATINSSGALSGTATSTANPSGTTSFTGTVVQGGGVAGLVIPAGQSSQDPFFGTVTIPSTNHLTIDVTVPGSSPSENLTVTLNLAKGSGSSPFTGSYKGPSFLNAGGGKISFATLNVLANGSFTGTSTDALSGNQSSFDGTIASDGTVIGSSGSSSLAGTLAFNSSNQLAGTLIVGQNGQSALDTVVFIKNGQPLQFVGNWAGPFSTIVGTGESGNESTTVSTSGTVSGVLTPTGGSPETYSGTINSLGQLTFSDPTETLTGGGALDASGNFIIRVKDNSGNVLGATLSPTG